MNGGESGNEKKKTLREQSLSMTGRGVEGI